MSTNNRAFLLADKASVLALLERLPADSLSRIGFRRRLAQIDAELEQMSGGNMAGFFDDLTGVLAHARRRYEQGLRHHKHLVTLRRETGQERIEDTTGQIAEAFAGALPDTLWRRPAGAQEDA